MPPRGRQPASIGVRGLHSQVLCVFSTAFGLPSVPEVQQIENTASGSALAGGASGAGAKAGPKSIVPSGRDSLKPNTGPSKPAGRRNRPSSGAAPDRPTGQNAAGRAMSRNGPTSPSTPRA